MPSGSSVSSAPPILEEAPSPPLPSSRPSTVQQYLKQYFIYSCENPEAKATLKAARFEGNGHILYVLSEKRCEELWQESGLLLYEELRTSPHYPVRQVNCCCVKFS